MRIEPLVPLTHNATNAGERDAGPDRFIPPAMQHGQQLFWARLQLRARLTFNIRDEAANQPARLAHLETAMIVLFWSRATRDLLKSFGWGIVALHQVDAATKLPFPRRPPHSIFRSDVTRPRLF